MMIGLRLAIGVLAGGAFAFADAAVINSHYQVIGDEQASPIQAFDDGRALYLQLSNPADPPAPVGPAGPMAYTIRGPYMVLPIVPAFSLRFGPYQARVIADGASMAGAGDDGGVVSMTAPVDASARAPAAVVAGAELPAPSGPPRSAWGAGGVNGTITVTGRNGEVMQSPPPPSLPSVYPQATISEYAYGALPADRFRGDRRYMLKADGTSAGARAVLQAKGACDKARAQCNVQYAGASAGKIKIEEQV